MLIPHKNTYWTRVARSRCDQLVLTYFISSVYTQHMQVQVQIDCVESLGIIETLSNWPDLLTNGQFYYPATLYGHRHDVN